MCQIFDIFFLTGDSFFVVREGDFFNYFSKISEFSRGFFLGGKRFAEFFFLQGLSSGGNDRKNATFPLFWAEIEKIALSKYIEKRKAEISSKKPTYSVRNWMF